MKKILITFCCMDCGNKISHISALYGKGRCNPCSHIGINNPNYKGGKPKCCDCGIEVSYYGYTRCSKCHYKFYIGKNSWLFKNGLPNCIDCGEQVSHYKYTRCSKCIINFQTGENNPNWNNGSSFYPYSIEFTKELKLKIRIRDNFECQGCNIKESKHFRALDVHHIDYNKQDCTETNLITLCQICNIKANSNRDYWFAYYTYKIQNEILKNG